MIVNNEDYAIARDGEGWRVISLSTMRTIAKLDKNFEGESDDSFIKYDTKKDILYFNKKVKYFQNYSSWEDDNLIEDGYIEAKDGRLIRAGKL